MRRIMLRVAYDGTAYVGWQKQDNGTAVEEVLNNALKELTGEDIAVTGASRTDAGVHALDNVAVFDTETRIPADKFAFAVNKYLPADIKVQSSREVETDFNPRFSKSGKTYEYTVYNASIPNPLMERYSYFVHYRLDVEAMNRAAQYLIGEHDFASFCSAGAQVKTTVREIYSAECFRIFEQEGDDTGNSEGSSSCCCDIRPSKIVIRLTGGGFLYNMVRIIAGTLVQIGQGMYPPETMKDIIEACDRSKAGPTAPPQGLVLRSVRYDAERGTGAELKEKGETP